MRPPWPSVTAPLAATSKLAEAMPGRGLGERGRRAAGDGLGEREALGVAVDAQGDDGALRHASGASPGTSGR